jgi:hypothetical protein
VQTTTVTGPPSAVVVIGAGGTGSWFKLMNGVGICTVAHGKEPSAGVVPSPEIRLIGGRCLCHHWVDWREPWHMDLHQTESAGGIVFVDVRSADQQALIQMILQ